MLIIKLERWQQFDMRRVAFKRRLLNQARSRVLYIQRHQECGAINYGARQSSARAASRAEFRAKRGC